MAADVFAVGHEIFPRRNADANIPKRATLHHVFVVRPNEQAHINVIAER